jgi:diguanylate cyclase (GGDEF)-like protein
MQKIAILYDASQIVLSTFDLDEVLARILVTVRDYFHLHNGAILLVDGQELYVKSHFGHEERPSEFRVALGSGIVGSAAKLKRPLYVPDVATDPRYVECFPGTRSELAIPLMVRDEVVGVLDFQSDKQNAFDKETIDLLTLFSTQASIAIQNAELYTLEQRRSMQLEVINAISVETRTVTDINELLPKVCSLVRVNFAVDQASILLLEDKRLVLRAVAGDLTSLVPLGWNVPFGTGISGKALADMRTIVVNDVRSFSGYVPGYSEARSEMCVPLVSFGERLGVLVLDNAANSFESTDIQPLESVADICAAAIKNAHSFELARQQADVDGLTGIYNRRYLEKRIHSEIERLSRYNHGMAILMVDIDNFKRINDEFGHLLGDEVLRHASRLMSSHLRKADIICRYGGEEFAIVLPETIGEPALGVAEKLRRHIQDYNFPGVPRRVTISIGVADFPDHGQTRDELIKSADDALYAAKQAGRNKVIGVTAARAATLKMNA